MKPYYEHAGITIYHGDCREVLPGMRADLLVTDPPYGLGSARRKIMGFGDKRGKNGLGGANPSRRDYGDSNWDDIRADDETIRLCMAVTRNQIIWGGNYFTLPPTKGVLVWDKLRGETDFADGEMAWTSFDRALRIFRYRWNGFLVDSDSRDVRLHPTQKPLALMKWCIMLNGTPANVLDAFAGSGTTLEAAKTIGIPAIGIEIEEKYCEIAARRLSQEVLDLQ